MSYTFMKRESEALPKRKSPLTGTADRTAVVPTPVHPSMSASDVPRAKFSRSASRSKHFLRRYITLQQRIASNELVVVKVDDANMPSDFLTKWLPTAKLRKSIAYATNSNARGS